MCARVYTGVCVCEFELFFILARHLLFVLCHFYSRSSDFHANSFLALPIKLFIGVFGGIFFLTHVQRIIQLLFLV